MVASLLIGDMTSWNIASVVTIYNDDVFKIDEC